MLLQRTGRRYHLLKALNTRAIIETKQRNKGSRDTIKLFEAIPT